MEELENGGSRYPGEADGSLGPGKDSMGEIESSEALQQGIASSLHSSQ